MTYLSGFDIGGTKCSVSVGRQEADGTLTILAKERFPTPHEPEEALTIMMNVLEQLLQHLHLPGVEAIGISCGSPLNSELGLVHSPPNLPHWNGIDVVSPVKQRFRVPVGLQNDANACALSEWRWGAGRGTRNMLFLTFGTGMGAGLILNGRLYTGTNDMAGEIGHIRLEHDGPVGYGKAGSFEGFCSGGGIARLAAAHAEAVLKAGGTTSFCCDREQLASITAQSVGEAAQNGDPTALKVFHLVGEELGRGLSVLVDILNPEMIVIGSIYGRQQKLLEPVALEVLKREALPEALSVCKVVPAALGERVGDYAGLSVAMHALSMLADAETVNPR
ncbi:ROK family protein [Paenibacillus sp. Dod16]|uniref:ROK family protein n=1 Tax=Paenibacillus sp. Dod16 TaxID=3416392 RepID=UPI003CF55D00